MFNGFTPAALAFFRDLAANNNKPWFLEHKADYDTLVVAPFRELLKDVGLGCAARDIPLGSDPAKALFRIYRDVRFSKDKTPYKTNAGAALTRDGGKSGDNGVLYIHLAPEGSFIASGFYHPEPVKLGAIREAIFTEPARFAAVLDGLAQHGLALSDDDKLTRLPKGYEDAAGQPMAEALKHKSFVTSRQLPEQLLSSPDLVSALVDFAGLALPLLRFGWNALSVIDPTDLKRAK
jgi:uncharacterized protein (TIGR02453 family)